MEVKVEDIFHTPNDFDEGFITQQIIIIEEVTKGIAKYYYPLAGIQATRKVENLEKLRKVSPVIKELYNLD